MTRAMETIQQDALKLTRTKIMSAIESLDWPTVMKLAEQLEEIAARGMHRHSIDNVAPKLRNINHRESDPR